MKPAKQRLLDALANGPLPYHELATIVYPKEHYPKAWNYSSNGGPPGCYMALSAMIRRTGCTTTWNRHDQRIIGPPKNQPRTPEPGGNQIQERF